MPLKQQDTGKLNNSSGTKENSNGDAKDIKVKYGHGQNAELDSAAEKTQRQEYAADGLMKTAKYSVDNTKADRKG